MTAYERHVYERVAEQLREEPLAGRRCTGCGGPILQRPIDNEGTVTFEYDCTCPGATPIDKSFPWGPVPPRVEGIEF